MFKHSKNLRKFTAIAALLACYGVAFAAPSGSDQASQALASCSELAPGQALSLELAAQSALCHSPLIKQASAAYQGAQGNVQEAQAARAAQVSASMSVDTAQAGANSRSARLGLSYVLFDFGRSQAALTGQTEARSASAQAVRDTEQRVLLGVAQSYFDASSASERVDAAQASLAAAQLSETTASARFAAGDVPRIDVLQAQSARAQAELGVSRAQAAWLTSQAALAQSVGWDAGAPVTLASEQAITEKQVPELAALRELMRVHHPAVLGAQSSLRSAKARAESAQALGKPTLTLTGSVSSFASNAIAPTQSSALGLNLAVPLYDGGSNQAQQLIARASVDAAQGRLETEMQSTSLALVRAHAELLSGKQSYLAASAFLQAAKQTQDAAQGRYQHAVGTMTDLLSAQAQVSLARVQMHDARQAWHMAQLSLERAMGTLTTSSF